MRLLMILSIFLICVTFSEQVAKFINCPLGLPRQREIYKKECIEVTCLPAHAIEIVGCPVDDCRRVIGFERGDPNKEYPGCCNRTICSNN